MAFPPAGRHRGPRGLFSRLTSEAKVVLWVGVATVLATLMGAAATLVDDFWSWANPPSAPASPRESDPVATPTRSPAPATPTASSPAVTLPPLTEIPAGFLLHEADVIDNPAVFRAHDRPVGFDLIACPPFDLAATHYTDIRTLQEARNGRNHFETLILFRTEPAAARVFGALQGAIQGCPQSPLPNRPGGTVHRAQLPYAGDELPSGAYDESMLAWETSYYGSAGESLSSARRMIVTRRGSALIIYSNLTFTAPPPNDLPPLVSETAEILPKLCKFNEPRCP